MQMEHTSLTQDVAAYCNAVSNGTLPRAYRGILSVLTSFKSAWEVAHPQDNVGALYQGYMDMSFVAVAPAAFGARRLKISLVFLHDSGTFSLWLAAGNRDIQKRVSEALRSLPLGNYSLSTLEPGVDAIIAYDLPKPYTFDDPQTLNAALAAAAEAFARDMISLTASI